MLILWGRGECIRDGPLDNSTIYNPKLVRYQSSWCLGSSKLLWKSTPTNFDQLISCNMVLKIDGLKWMFSSINQRYGNPSICRSDWSFWELFFCGVSPWQELIKRSHLPSRGDGMHLRSPPSDPLHKQGTGGWPGCSRQSYSNVPGQTGGDPGKLNERILSFKIYPVSFPCGLLYDRLHSAREWENISLGVIL